MLRSAMTLQNYLTRLIWICTLPLLVLAALLAVDRWREQRIKDEEEGQHLLQAAKRLLDDSLQSRLAGLQTLAASPLANDPDTWPAFRMEARGYLAAFGNHVALIDAQRRTRMHTMVPLGDEPPPAPKPTGRSAISLALTPDGIRTQGHDRARQGPGGSLRFEDGPEGGAIVVEIERTRPATVA